MNSERYAVYGLVVDCDRVLFRARTVLASRETAADVVIRHADRERDTRSPGDGELLLRYELDDVRYYCERLPDGTFSLVFDGACEFEISTDLREVTVFRHRDATTGIEDVLASGALLAWQLYMRGSLVLHASAVQVGDEAIAFVGGSGRGKSTMATLMCAAGARIVTDDLLRVDFVDGGPRVRTGSSELRLRKGADTLAAGFDDGAAPQRRISADDRQVLRPVDNADDGVPLAAIFVPVPDQGAASVRIDRIESTDALFALLRFPRLLGWIDAEVRSTQFALMSRLVERTPLSFAFVPWGPPFADDIAPTIAAELGAERVGRRLDLSPTAS